ncbi:MASE1 domain-containing protein [Laspinema olomoucense]|uniref:histidine kinase n=1 Tax=Laspinema olomoucense D3b TaxID=2953688 RepID=A0ABT2N459_9CYAN|nr:MULTISPECIES: MASE1 domain-containing protein [unclassified Laspinema]MCT7972345.1 MASE1 domain-containing protein [Laspinema sp. D3d]MCT7977468.1 MASE1 domain-containing protein [Laspinema sp. D3b]
MKRRLGPLQLRQNLILIAAIAFVYCVLGILGLKLAVLPGGVTAVWIPAGVGLGAVLVWGNRIWPSITLGSFGISVLVDPSPVSLAIAGVTAVGNTLTPLWGGALIRRLTHTRYPFHRANEVFIFVGCGAIAAQIISATVGILALCVAQWVEWSNFAQAWVTWWVSNVAGVLIFTPVLLTWHHFLSQTCPQNNGTRIFSHLGKIVGQELQSLRLESLTWFLLFDGVVSLAFWYGYPVEYLMIPLLGWAAFRFSERWTTLAIALTGLMAIAGTILNRSSFVRDNLNASLLFLESFIGVISVTTLVLIAVLQERRHALEGLQQAKAELEYRVIQRTQQLSQANEQLTRQEVHLKEKAESLATALRQVQQTQGQLIHNEKMISLGQLVAGIAHEINNPVSFIYSNLSPATDYFRDILDLLSLYQEKHPEPDPEIVEMEAQIDLPFVKKDLFKLLNSMKSGADRIQRIVMSLRNFSRLDEAQLKAVDVHEGLESTLLILQHRIQGSESLPPHIEVIKDYSKLPPVECLAGELNQVFMNLLSNAIDAIEANTPDNLGRIHIQTRELEGEQIQITITDNGGGIPPAVQNKIFDPFFTTKPVGHGTGLGLYISYEMIVQKHHGTLSCRSEPGVSTTFEITLPLRHTSDPT